MVSRIGKRVKEARVYSGLTQEKLAELSGVSWSFISRLECGNANASVSTLLKIASALDIGIDVLFCDYFDTDIDPLTNEIIKCISGMNEKQKLYILKSVSAFKELMQANG